MRALRKTLSILVYLIPVGVLITGCYIKGIALADAGAMLCGMVILLIGCLYIWFGCPKEKKLPLGIMLAGLIITLCSFIAIILGIVLVITPGCYIGGAALWKKKISLEK